MKKDNEFKVRFRKTLKSIGIQKKRSYDTFLLKKVISAQINNNLPQIQTDSEIYRRNFKRINDIIQNKPVFCPIINKKIYNLIYCHFLCRFGHITECHYPYDCNSKYCREKGT